MSFRSRNTFTGAFGLCMEAVGWESRLHMELPASDWCVTLSVDSGWDCVNGMVTLGHVQVEWWWHRAPGFAVLVSSVCPFCSRWSCGIWAQTWHFRSRLLLQWGALSPEPQFAVGGQDWVLQLRHEGERKKKRRINFSWIFWFLKRLLVLQSCCRSAPLQLYLDETTASGWA